VYFVFRVVIVGGMDMVAQGMALDIWYASSRVGAITRPKNG